MKILGISGIDGTVDFKKRHWPARDDREYRISQGHDSAAALVIDGEFVAGVAEERIARRKHTGDFPVAAIESCLRQAGIRAEELDEVVHGFDYGPYGKLYELDPISSELYHEVLSREAFAAKVAERLPGVPADRIRHLDHHLAHASSAYYTSGWDECLVITIDGMGEAHGATVYHAADGKLEPVFRIAARNSIGILYSVLTLHLGFEFNSDEYKVMGLAPYGDPERFRGFFEEIVSNRPDGGWDIELFKHNRTREERESHEGARRYLTEHLIEPREPEAEIAAVHQDVAAGLQAMLDRAVLHLCSHFGQKLGIERLALAGGVALNTTANSRLTDAGIFDEIYVQPAAADDGTSLGAALHRAALAGEVVNERSPTPFYGPGPAPGAVEQALQAFADQIEVEPLSSLEAACAAAAELIGAGEVVAWYRGRMEFGPRALGHRSILADPGREEMRDRVNALVKMREAFRPFAPAVSVEQAHRFFEVTPGTELPYMNVNVTVRPEYRSELPATTHVDGSARLQTVSTRDNPEFHELLRAIGTVTGKELVLNTSFNVRGQAIVNTPAEAIETFLTTGIHALMLENALVRKRAR
jgi:carbamoyltransferase